jgi:hypothetical protein
MILEAQQMKIDSLVRLLDTGVGQVLIPIAQVKRAARSESQSRAEMTAELKAGSKSALGAHGGLG